MRYATFSFPGGSEPRLGVVRENRIWDLKGLIGSASERAIPSTMQELIDSGSSVWKETVRLAEQGMAKPAGAGVAIPLEHVMLHAPIPRPRKNVICLGLNYAAHAEESAKARGRSQKIPEVPVFFTKAPTAVAGPQDDIPWDRSVTAEVDYEAELAVIVGVGGKNIPRDKALGHIFGYTIINDFSARDLQLRHMQWFKGKSLDGFCPMGPYIVTPDEFGDPQNKKICLRVNGATKQDSTTASMIFSIAVIIEFLSRGMTLEPGDVISTGTPEGVGLGRTPPEYLNDGDLVETEVEGIGMLRNRIVSSGLAPCS